MRIKNEFQQLIHLLKDSQPSFTATGQQKIADIGHYALYAQTVSGITKYALVEGTNQIIAHYSLILVLHHLHVLLELDESFTETDMTRVVHDVKSQIFG